jgi:hypothetical protein
VIQRGAAALLALALGCSAPPAPAPAAPDAAGQVLLPEQEVAPLPPFQRGMVYGIFGREGTEFHRKNLEEIRDLGVDSIQIVVPRAMKTIHSTTISPDDATLTPSRHSLEQAVAEARRLDLRVFLFPIVFVRNLEEGEWRGVLAPDDWDVWWENYRAFILEEARWAEEHQVEFFSVGSELLSTEAMEDRWRQLLSDVRGIYGGLLTYSANWDQLEVIGFTDALDFLGMNAYFEVGDGAPTLPGLLHRWQEPVATVAAWQARHRKPVVITEIGYPSRRGGTVNPWDYLDPGPADVEEQDLGYQAFILAWRDQPWLAGTYFYMWWDDSQEGGRGYTPREKPAARTLSRWYTSPEP